MEIWVDGRRKVAVPTPFGRGRDQSPVPVESSFPPLACEVSSCLLRAAAEAKVVALLAGMMRFGGWWVERDVEGE